MSILCKNSLTILKDPMPPVGLSDPRKYFESMGEVGDKLFGIGEEGERLREGNKEPGISHTFVLESGILNQNI